MLAGPFSPEINDAFTVAPEVVYSPIVPLPFVSKICARAVPGTAQSAAEATKAVTIDRIFRWFPFRNRRGKVISAVDPLLCLTPERLGAFGSTAILVKSAYQCQEFCHPMPEERVRI